jgi:hypothetical protein
MQAIQPQVITLVLLIITLYLFRMLTVIVSHCLRGSLPWTQLPEVPNDGRRSCLPKITLDLEYEWGKKLSI